MIHCFTVNNHQMVLDVASGAVHAVDGTAYRILQLLQQNEASLHKPGFNKEAHTLLFDCPAQEVDEALTEIQALAAAGQLFSEENVDAALEDIQAREPVVKALCLHIAHECNLDCAYCFAGQGTYGTERGFMSPETGKKAIDFLIKHSGKRRNLEVDFFGGEPTLNFDTVKEIVAYGRSREREAGKHFRFTLTTNGTLLDDETNCYINEHMDNVVLSIDGRPAVHNRMRAQQGGIGSHDTLLTKLLALAESRNHERYYVRGTYTRHNLDFAGDVLHLADAGFTQISVEPVVAPLSADYSLRQEDVPVLCDEYEKLASAILSRKREGKPFNFFHFMLDLDGGPCLAKRITGCGAGTEYLAVTPGGSLYPCHQFVGEADYRLGDLDTGVVNQEIGERFACCNVLEKEECARCWAKYYCSGGCAANAYHQRGDLLLPDETGCALMRKRIECALYLYAEDKNLL